MTLLANRYLLTGRIGEGGEAEVLSAQDQWHQGYPVAIKKLKTGSCATLAREFISLKRLKHPHVVRALDLVYVGSVSYLVQERIVGLDLREWSRQNSAEALMRLVAPIAHALSHLHARGWVHFDPTASNIVVDSDSGRACILDLGLVQPIGAEYIGGTPGYMAPELYNGKPISDRVDIFTFGKSIWELLVDSDPSYADRAEVRALFISAMDPIPSNRPSAHRLAKTLYSLSGLPNDPLLQRPITSLPLCAREAQRAQLTKWFSEPCSVFSFGGASGNGLSAFLEYCVEELKLRGFYVLTVSAKSRDPIKELLFQAISLAPQPSDWLSENKETLWNLCEHPRISLGSQNRLPPISGKERAQIVLLLLEELAMELSLAVAIDDGATGSASTSWDHFLALLKMVDAQRSLQVVINEGGECISPDRCLSPFTFDEVAQFLCLAYGYPPLDAEVSTLLELASGKPKLLQAALNILASTGKTVLELSAEDLNDSSLLLCFPRELEPLRILNEAIPTKVVLSLLESLGEKTDLGKWIHEGFLVPIGQSEVGFVSVPHVFRVRRGRSRWYKILSSAYGSEGFEFESELLSIKSQDGACEPSQIDRLLELTTREVSVELFHELHASFGKQPFTKSHLLLWARESATIGDVRGVELASNLLEDCVSDSWKAAKMGEAFNRVGRFRECMEKTKLYLSDVDCVAVFVGALLASGKAAEAVELGYDFRDEQNAMMAGTLGSALCQIGKIELGIESLRRAIELAQEEEDLATLSRSWHGLAIAYQRSSRQEEAVGAYEQAIQFSNPISYISRSINFGTLLQDLGTWSEAERRFRESLSRALILGNTKDQSQSGVNLGNLLVLGGQLEEGFRVAQWTESLCAKHGLTYPRAMTLLILTESFLERGDPLGAAPYLEQAKDELKTISDPTAMGEWKLLQARFDLLNTNYSRSNETFTILLVENFYPELRWRVVAWSIYGKLFQRLPVARDDIEILQATLNEIRKENNLRFEWKILALLGECFERRKDSKAQRIKIQAGQKLNQWRMILASQDKTAYFKTYFRRELLSYVENPHKREAENFDMKPDISFIRQLMGINRRLAREHELDVLLELIVDAAIELIGAERGFILIRKNEGVAVAVARNLDKRTIDEGSHGISRSIALEVLTNGEKILTTNALEDRRFSHVKSVSAFRLRSILCLPLRVGRGGEDLLIGSLYLDNRFQERAFSEHEMELCAALADQASIAMENARLFSEIRLKESELADRNKELESLNSRLKKDVARYESQAEQALRRLREEGTSVGVGVGFERFVGSSASLKKALRLVERFADTDVPVLIRGESGTGKELVARAFHERSRRKSRAFVSINCGAMPGELIESELFGYKKGAFTGASRDKKGLIGEAEGGTLFFDEIGEMPVLMQVKLLRVLQEREYRPLGSSQTLPCDIRILSATNRDLAERIQEGCFREDFYYRIQVLEVLLPPLRERREDIPALVEHFCRKIVGRSMKQSMGKEALAAMLAYDWPGNIRELENEIRRSLALSDGVMGVVDLSEKLQHVKLNHKSTLIDSCRGSLREIMDGFEKEVLLAALERNNWNVKRTASELGLSRASFYSRLNRYSIKR